MNKAFSVIGPCYDALMENIEYEKWVDYIIKIFKKKKFRPSYILDLACGTGTPTILIAKKGIKVLALDSSPGMLDVLKKKIEKEKLPITTIKGDMRDFKIDGKVDACISLFDSINYLLNEKDLARCFKSVYESLRKPGLFLFDVNTIYALKEVWGTGIITRENNNIYSIWKTVWNQETMLSRLHLTVFIKNGEHYDRLEEIHLERAYPLSTYEKYLKNANFKNIEFFHHLTFNAPLEISSRVMVVAEKL